MKAKREIKAVAVIIMIPAILLLFAAGMLLPKIFANEDTKTLYDIKDIVNSRVTPSARRFPEKMKLLGSSGSILSEEGRTTIISSRETEEDFSDVIAAIPEITKEVNELISQSEHLSYPAVDIEIYIEHWAEWNIRVIPKQNKIILGINERISFAEAMEYCHGFEDIDVGGYCGYSVDLPDNVGELFADFDGLRSLRIDSILYGDTETALRGLSGLDGVDVTLGTFENGKFKRIL